MSYNLFLFGSCLLMFALAFGAAELASRRRSRNERSTNKQTKAEYSTNRHKPADAPDEKPQ